MINVPLQDDIYAHRLLFVFYDLLFAWDLWTFYLKISEGLKLHLPFILRKNFTSEGEGTGKMMAGTRLKLSA